MASDKIVVLITGLSPLSISAPLFPYSYHSPPHPIYPSNPSPGANTGIGYRTAEILSTYPRYHTILGCRDVSKGQAALSTLQALSPTSSLSLVQLDVTCESSISAAAASIEKDHGRLDVLVNNAAIMSHKTTLVGQLRELFETNTIGAAAVTEEMRYLLLRSEDARIVYVTSELGSVVLRLDKEQMYYGVTETAYRMSKAAINMLVACQHVEDGPRGVKLWAFDPGYVVTNLSGTGEKGIQERIDRGAGDARESARALVDIVLGKRDGDVGKLVHKDGEHPW